MGMELTYAQWKIAGHFKVITFCQKIDETYYFSFSGVT